MSSSAKKFLSLFLALTMAFALAAVPFAGAVTTGADDTNSTDLISTEDDAIGEGEVDAISDGDEEITDEEITDEEITDGDEIIDDEELPSDDEEIPSDDEDIADEEETPTTGDFSASTLLVVAGSALLAVCSAAFVMKKVKA